MWSDGAVRHAATTGARKCPAQDVGSSKIVADARIACVTFIKSICQQTQTYTKLSLNCAGFDPTQIHPDRNWRSVPHCAAVSGNQYERRRPKNCTSRPSLWPPTVLGRVKRTGFLVCSTTIAFLALTALWAPDVAVAQQQPANTTPGRPFGRTIGLWLAGENTWRW
jgi:hypothetical protein